MSSRFYARIRPAEHTETIRTFKVQLADSSMEEIAKRAIASILNVNPNALLIDVLIDIVADVHVPCATDVGIVTEEPAR